mmetsp:Transcript_73284/g.114723  ORF Transcript_73284/g.114723 Transcript_73284/m.114723 type:complete len:206 (-) Transcript_73284:539-1156(-)
MSSRAIKQMMRQAACKGNLIVSNLTTSCPRLVLHLSPTQCRKNCHHQQKSWKNMVLHFPPMQNRRSFHHQQKSQKSMVLHPSPIQCLRSWHQQQKSLKSIKSSILPFQLLKNHGKLTSTSQTLGESCQRHHRCLRRAQRARQLHHQFNQRVFRRLLQHPQCLSRAMRARHWHHQFHQRLLNSLHLTCNAKASLQVLAKGCGRTPR